MTAVLSGWSKLLGTLVGWDSPSIGVWVKRLQDSSVIGIVDEPIVFWLGSEIGTPLGYLLDYEAWIIIGIQFIVDIPPGSNIRY